ncbi:site-specific integrase [Ralstonia pseudosolanacearum]|uniref:site-specific integrase n=1 Tax=Ralstonia pseudosolanacearum TaxID=1310165 RepID=UPI00399B22E6
MGKAKKSALKLLPPTWREDMFACASQLDWCQSRPQLLPALALLWVTGCRPTEIEQGVRVYSRGDQLVIEVLGAKCNEAGAPERGQPKRTYGFVTRPDANSAEHPALAVLRVRAEQNMVDGTGSTLVVHSADYLYNSVVALGKVVFPKLRTRVSPYCFRHQMASDLKADPAVPLEDAAKLMGHLSDYSIGRYGRAVHGKRGGERVKAVMVKTSRPVKHSPKVDKLARFKIASANRRKLKPS